MAPGKKSEAPADMSVTAGVPLAAEGGVLSALSKGDDPTSPFSCGVTTEASLVSAEAASSGHCCLPEFLLSTNIFWYLLLTAINPGTRKAYRKAYKMLWIAFYYHLVIMLPIAILPLAWFLHFFFSQGVACTSIHCILSGLSFFHFIREFLGSTKSVTVRQLLCSGFFSFPYVLWALSGEHRLSWHTYVHHTWLVSSHILDLWCIFVFEVKGHSTRSFVLFIILCCIPISSADVALLIVFCL